VYPTFNVLGCLLYKNIRLYSDADIEKLSRIMVLREAGVALADIASLLGAANLEVTALLFRRLGEINKEIEAAKSQQSVIVKLLEGSIVYKKLKTIDEETWRAILNTAGIKADEWHAQFEKHSPQEHQHLLELLGFDEEEILQQREHYKNAEK
jgi:DNA-binding transcriptional MerR regulator